VPTTKRKKPQHPWLRREVLNHPREDNTPPARSAAIALPATPDPVIVGPHLLDRHLVCAKAQTSYPTLWEMMRRGLFPRGRIHGGKTKWLSTEVDQWMAALPIRRLKGDAP
jgi:predicted DNA-binding transcriptional regulator AlpA